MFSMRAYSLFRFVLIKLRHRDKPCARIHCVSKKFTLFTVVITRSIVDRPRSDSKIFFFSLARRKSCALFSLSELFRDSVH